jgi:hypothetical protein
MQQDSVHHLFKEMIIDETKRQSDSLPATLSRSRNHVVGAELPREVSNIDAPHIVN